METIETLIADIGRHGALTSPFYALWQSRQFRIEELELFASNYGAWVKSFPDALAILFEKTDDVHAKTEYAKTLFSEMGYGNPEKVHWVLLDEFFTMLGLRLGERERLSRKQREWNSHLLTTTVHLIEGERELYGHGDRAIAAGAQLALEWQAYTMLRKLYEGARNYQKLWMNEDEFSEACEYFYVHLGAAEKDHKQESLIAAQRLVNPFGFVNYGKDDIGIKEIQVGFNRHLDLIAGFWDGLYIKMQQLGHGTHDP